MYHVDVKCRRFSIASLQYIATIAVSLSMHTHISRLDRQRTCQDIYCSCILVEILHVRVIKFCTFQVAHFKNIKRDVHDHMLQLLAPPPEPLEKEDTHKDKKMNKTTKNRQIKIFNSATISEQKNKNKTISQMFPSMRRTFKQPYSNADATSRRIDVGTTVLLTSCSFYVIERTRRLSRVFSLATCLACFCFILKL